MHRISYAQAAFWGVFTGAGVIGVTYLGHDLFNLPYVASDFFEFITRLMPGPLVIGAIELMVRIITLLRLGPTAAAAKQAESALAVLEFLAAGGFFGLVIAALWEGGHRRLPLYGFAGSIIFTAISMFINGFFGFNDAALLPSLIWLFIVYATWGLVLQRLVAERALPMAVVEATPKLETTTPPTGAIGGIGAGAAPAGVQSLPAPRMSRRQFMLLVVAGVFTAVLSALRVNYQRTAAQAPQSTSAPPPNLVADSTNTSGPAASPSETILSARFAPVPGTRLELTPSDKFYRVDINLEPPRIDVSGWILAVDGLVDHPLSLTLEDIHARPSYSQAITLECISNPVGGDLISSGVWTGVRLKDILQEAGLKAGAGEVFIESADGFYETVTSADIQDDRTLLVYAMDGQPLAAEHGFPLRIYIPGRYGMKMPKWIIHLKVVDHPTAGYWVERGWSQEAIVNTTSVIDIVAANQRQPNSGLVPMGGIAYAGDRGISKVEIKVDGNPWQLAELRDPPLSPLTWVQWRYFWQPTPGEHTLLVRATDNAGVLQRVAETGTYPDGATGYYQVKVKI
jgi:DMSO/TMAO reductase YedYZ molybdopterin-dependent catalytic subunit